MPAATAVMVLTNVGLQLFNNWRNTQTSDEMRRKQQEFQRAAQDRNYDHMLQLLHEGQDMQEQWEAENHEQRIKNINEDFDNLIKRTFQAQALKKWPLEVLPMVMKNQSLGSFRSQSDENIALHVILTPSNSRQFNETVYPHIGLGVEAFCNRHWNNLSDHPIIFYNTDAWRSGTAPKQTEIDQLKADLEHLPVLMITPYFSQRDGMVFKVNMWGMGKLQEYHNDEQIDINTTEMVIQPSEQEFSYYNLYATDTNYGDELTEVTIEEFVPYLQCMIGYLADVYFWSAHGIAPILPSLLTMGVVNTDGMKYLLDKTKVQYYSLAKECVQNITKEDDVFYSCVNPIAIFRGAKVLWNETEQNPIDNLYNDIEKKGIEIEVVYLETLSLTSVYNHILSFQNNYLEPTDFIFALWNDFVIVGVLVNSSGQPSLDKNLQEHYYIYTNEQDFSALPNNEIEYYKFNINTTNLTKMKKEEKNPVSSMRERLGKILIKHGESLLKDLPQSGNRTNPSSVWGNTPENDSEEFTLDDLRDFFVHSINEQNVSAEAIEGDMSISVALNWLKQLDLTDIDANKLYLLKTYVEEYDRYMYCAFLGNNTSILLADKYLQLTKCFVCKYESSEMKELYGTKSLYVIPFEK